MEKNYSVDDMLAVIDKAISITNKSLEIMETASKDLVNDIRYLELDIGVYQRYRIEENNV